jgi:NAD(P)-dependent dehydrogenase (short-subunit alcohol dehydrogenase family)
MCWLQLANKTAIITGAASGIGRAVAQTLQDAGCRLVLADLNVQQLRNDFSTDVVTTVECDVSIRQQVDAMIRTASPDASILVNCAGITRDGYVEKLTEQDWDRVLDVNLKGTFNTCQSFLQIRSSFGTTGAASIINVGSIVSEQGNIGQVNYAASKGGVIGLTRALAKEVAQRGIRVNAVLPGFIETPMSQAVPLHILTAIQKKIALQHFGQPEDVANIIAFLASERSRYITGETIECSGMISL